MNESGGDSFKIRPRKVVIVEAYGGELVLHWSSWTRTSASGAGTAYPDHGHYPIRVLASRVYHGHFMRLQINRKVDSHWREELLFLDYSSPDALGWDPQSWIENAQSGLTFYGE
jgi:hypothetical protein